MSLFVDRILKCNMGNFARGIFTFVVGVFFFVGLLLVGLAPCIMFGKSCPDS